MMELFTKIVLAVNNFHKISIIDVWQGPKYMVYNTVPHCPAFPYF